jgi:hypothetical protein
MNWKIGQKLVCIHGSNWEYRDGNLSDRLAPKKGEIVTFDGVDESDRLFILLKEYPESYSYPSFRPVESHSAHISEAVRSSLPRPVEEVSDVPAPAVAICGNTNPILSLITMINTDGTMVAAGGKVPIWVVMK